MVKRETSSFFFIVLITLLILSRCFHILYCTASCTEPTFRACVNIHPPIFQRNTSSLMTILSFGFTVKMWNGSKIISRRVALTYMFSREKKLIYMFVLLRRPGYGHQYVRPCVHLCVTRKITSYDTSTYRIKP